MTRNVWKSMGMCDMSHTMSEEWDKFGHAWLSESAWHSMYANGCAVCLWSVTQIKTFQQSVASNPDIRDPSLQFCLEFIEIYRENTPLWNIRREEFYDKQLKAVCYDKLITKMKQVLPSAKINVTRKINTYTHIHTHTLTYTCVCTVFYVCTGFHFTCACVCVHIHHIFNCIP